MLKMLNKRRPTDEMYEAGQNICNFVAISFPVKFSKFSVLDLFQVENDWNLNPNLHCIYLSQNDNDSGH